MDTGIQGYRDTGTQEYRDTGIQGYRNTGIEGYRNTGIRTGIQEYRDRRIQKYRDTGIKLKIFSKKNVFMRLSFLLCPAINYFIFILQGSKRQKSLPDRFSCFELFLLQTDKPNKDR